MSKKQNQDAAVPEDDRQTPNMASPTAEKPATAEEMQSLADELAEVRRREEKIRAAMQNVSAKQLAEAAKVTSVDHLKALRAASEELRKAGMIPGPGSHRRRN